MKVWKGCWKLKDFGSLNIYMHSISGAMEREENITKLWREISIPNGNLFLKSNVARARYVHK